MKRWMVACSLVSLLSACASNPEAPLADTQASPQLSLAAPVLPGQPLTLKQVMADPDWIGNAPMGAYWNDDSQSVFYQRKQDGSKLRDRYQHALDGAPQKLALGQWGAVSQPGQTDASGNRKAWLYEGNLFVRDLASGTVRQLTRDSKGWQDFRFLNDGRIAAWAGERVELIDPATGARTLLAELKFEAAPEPETAEGFLAEQQARLIDYVAQQYRDAEQKHAQQNERQASDATLAPKPFYLGGDERLVELSVSPSGRYLMVAVTDSKASWRSDHDIMPNYLDKRGYVDAVPARARVAEAEVKPHRLVVLDTRTQQQVNVTWEGLEGYDEDVLAAVKRENAEARGERYDSENALRTIRLMEDWGWNQSAMAWHPSEDKLVVMLEAADNKDRWIAAVDLAKGKLRTEHRLHDDAWVNYTHNEFGWAGDKLYFLSEQSGYSNLYLKPLGGKADALVSGRQVVSNLTLSNDGQHLYYKANPHHPGQYEVFRVALASGQVEQLTDLKGMLEYQLSPDEQQLLLEYSSRTRPVELYVQAIGGEARQLTQTTKEAFLAYDWQAPQVVEDQVTYPLSTAMLSVPGAVDVRGYSFFGDSFVYVIFEDGTDLYWARSRVLEYLNQVSGQLPPSARPVLGPDATGVGWVYQYALKDESGRHDLAQLRSIQDWFLKYELKTVPGVAEVATVGGMVRQYQVILNPDALRAFGLPLARVRDAIQRGNREVGGSVIEMGEAEYMVRATGYLDSVEDLGEIPLGMNRNGTPIRLQDVADPEGNVIQIASAL